MLALSRVLVTHTPRLSFGNSPLSQRQGNRSVEHISQRSGFACEVTSRVAPREAYHRAKALPTTLSELNTLWDADRALALVRAPPGPVVSEGSGSGSRMLCADWGSLTYDDICEIHRVLGGPYFSAFQNSTQTLSGRKCSLAGLDPKGGLGSQSCVRCDAWKGSHTPLNQIFLHWRGQLNRSARLLPRLGEQCGCAHRRGACGLAGRLSPCGTPHRCHKGGRRGMQLCRAAKEEAC